MRLRCIYFLMLFVAADLFAVSGDINHDGYVDLADFAELSMQWLRDDCQSPAWCGEADLDQDGYVVLADFVVLAQHWMELTVSAQLAGYEPLETNLTVTPASWDTGLTVTWPVLGGAGGVPQATEGDYVLKMDWAGETDGKVELKHQWSNFAFDLTGYDYIYLDVYTTTQLSPDVIFIWDDLIGWCGSSILPVPGQWTTLKFDVSGCNEAGIDRIHAIVFEGMDVSNGTVYLDNLRVNPKVSASSYEKDEYLPKYAIDGNSQTRWASEFSEPEWITVDLCEMQTIDRVELNWETACAQRYQVQVSEDGVIWYTVYETTSGSPGQNVITFSPVSVRCVRMYGILRATQWGMSLWEFEVSSTTASAVPLSTYPVFDEYSVLPLIKSYPTSWYDLKAQLDPRGEYPGWFYDEFSYWTVAGDPNSEFESLMSDEGVIGNKQNDFSLIPYLYIDGNLIKPTDVTVVVPPLEEGYLPIPTIRWIWSGGITFDQKLFSSSDSGKAYNNIWYTLENTSGSNITGKLFLTVRPFQVTPDWMYGGYVNINSIEGSGNVIKVNNIHGFAALTLPNSFGALTYEDGDIMDFIRVGNVPTTTNVTSGMGYASAALSYNLNIGSDATAEYKFIIPSYEDNINSFNLPLDDASFNAAYNTAKADWGDLLNQVNIDIPDTDIVNTFKSNLAYILVSKDGPAIQPGSRNYDRSWIRDGAIMGISLVRAGQDPLIIKDYIDWYTPFQYANGRIPPVLHSEGFEADRDKVINEYDAQGEYIYLISEYYKFTGDLAFLADKYPAIIKALQYAEERRSIRLTSEYVGTRFYGILPESISHEGYPEPGMHSYWDDFWVIKGWEEAIQIAQILNYPTDVAWMQDELDNSVTGFRKCVTDSIQLAMQMGGISYIPGCAESYDFDATSTAICVWPTVQQSLVNMNDLMFTLDKYYDEIFIPRDTNGLIYGYTPYEMRTATAYIMLGQKEKALRMLNYFLQDCRPKEWNHWSESVEPEYRAPRYLAEMPHAWIGGIFNNLVMNLFVYPENDKIILGAGIDELWLDQQSVTLGNFPTYSGDLSYTVTEVGDVLEVEVSGAANPAGGFVFKYPYLNQAIVAVTINDQTWLDFTDTEVSFTTLPASIKIYK
jgi:F5/8 type C domain-containing protein